MKHKRKMSAYSTQKDKTHLIISFTFAFYGSFFLFFLYKGITTKVIMPSELESISSQLLSPPEIELHRGTRNINLRIQAFPKSEFVIGSIGFDIIINPVAFAKTAKVGDSLSISILKKDYEKMIVASKPERIISVYELKYNNYNFLTLSAHNDESMKDRRLGIIVMTILSAVMSWLSIKNLIKYLKS